MIFLFLISLKYIDLLKKTKAKYIIFQKKILIKLVKNIFNTN